MQKLMSIKEFKALNNKPKKSKYRNVRTTVDGIVFDSKKEAARYSELKLLEGAGIITNLQLQVKFILQNTTYIADFVYYIANTSLGGKGWEYVVEDVKSAITKKNPLYRLKKKMMLSMHGIEIKEV